MSRVRVAVRKAKSGREDGYEGFKASEEEVVSEKTMLLETATDDINNYLIEQLVNSN